MMQLKIFVPSKMLVDISVQKIISEDVNGSFCLLPKHIDCVRVLVPNILVYYINNEEEYVGLDEGILVKCKKEINICTRNGVSKAELGTIKKTFEKNLSKSDEDEKQVRKILNELEIDFIKRYTEIKKI